MKSSIDFLKAIGHTDRVYIRCLSPKNASLPELEALGMTYQDKSGTVKKSTVNGYIDLQTGELYRRYGTEYKPVTDGWQHLQDLNQQGYGIYFVVAHGGERNSDITHGTCLFHESDRATFEQQQLEIDRISSNFGKPNAVVKTRKSLHAYWASSETISIDNLATYQRRWLQYSNCDDSSLADPAQLMRLPRFDHLAWNPETQDFDRVQCQLLQLNEVSYSLAEFDRVLPSLDVARWCQQSLEIVESDADDRDMRSLAKYLIGFNPSGRTGWITAKCPAHNGESSDSLHIDSLTGGFICQAGCSSSAVYNATKAVAVASGHRFEVEDKDEELRENLKESINLQNGKAPNLFGGEVGKLLAVAAGNFNIPVEILNFCLLPILGSRIDARTKLLINPGTNFKVPAIRWCGLVGDTGSKKSPVINLLTDPLSRQQIELYDDYKEKKLDYDAEFTAWKAQKPADRDEEPKAPVPMLDLYFSNFTIEALVDSIQHHPNAGSMVMLDELAQFYKSLDMYRGGKGSDRQQWLTIWNGSGLKNNRKTSGAIVLPQTSIGILGGIQPETISNMVSGDDSQFDGLWNRFSFVGLPQFKTSAFTETPADLGTELDKVYRALSEQQHQTHCLSIESKPLWEAWHNEIEDKTLSGSTGLIKGTYAKFHGIAGRNALILHRTLAAINKTEPNQLINAAVMELAIAWTKWELSQTLLQYQLLGLTNDPELSRILKFIDKFTGKGSVSARDVTHWWSGREKPNTSEIKLFMAKIVSFGHAIDNDESIDSSKYRIQISINGSNSSNKNPKTNAQTQESLLLPLVTEYPQQNPDPNQGNVTKTVTTVNNKIESVGNGTPMDDFQKTVTKTVDNGSNKPETVVNGHHGGSVENSVTNGSNNINSLQNNNYSHSVTTVTTISKDSDLKIGSRYLLNGDREITLKTIDKVGTTADESEKILYHPFDLITSLVPMEHEGSSNKPITNGYKKKYLGDGFIEIVSNRSNNTSETIDDEGVEYEC
jgi:Protein of unknown function (DUF3987)